MRSGRSSARPTLADIVARRADIAGLGHDERAAWIDRSVFEHLTGFPQGILLRLHALGDFLPHGAGDTRYALMWSTLLSRYPGRAVFVYTHVPHASEVGRVLRAVNDEFPERSFIRFSNQPRATEFSIVSLDTVPDTPTVEMRGTVATVCPTQTGDFKCTDCGLCFSDDHRGAIAFISHERLAAHARSDD